MPATKYGANYTDPERGGAQWSAVDSSCISSFVYWTDRSTGQKILTVRFRESGKLYSYSGVPASVYARLISAPSRGKFMNAEIINRYPFVPG